MSTAMEQAPLQEVTHEGTICSLIPWGGKPAMGCGRNASMTEVCSSAFMV